MKTTQQILVLALIALGSFYVWVETRPVKPKSIPPEVVESAIPEKQEIKQEVVKPVVVPKAAPKPKTLVVPEVVAPVLPKVDYDSLPDGEFYVKEKVYETTPNGVRAFGVGEKVFKVAGGYTNGKVTLGDSIVSGDKLTRSRSEGLALIQSRSSSIPPVLANGLTEAVIPGTPVHTSEAKVVPSAPAVPKVNPRIAQIDAELINLYSELRRLQEKYATTSKVNASGPFIQRVETQIKKLEAERAALERR
jgi:hypothetical protein